MQIFYILQNNMLLVFLIIVLNVNDVTCDSNTKYLHKYVHDIIINITSMLHVSQCFACSE